MEAILFMDTCHPDRLVPNRVMLCVRGAFLMDNGFDILPEEYNDIIRQSGSAGIVR
jgi:hypothetical protein